MPSRFRHYFRPFSFGSNLILLVFVFAATITMTISLHCQTVQAQLETSPPVLPPMNLTVIGLNGTSVFLNSTDIANLPSVSGLGGYNTVDNYTGVSITTLCDLVGGINSDDVVRITAADNYSQTFTYEQIIDGNFTNATHSQPLTLIIAYYKNDANLTTQGPLMSAIIGPEGLLTNGHYWVWYSIEIQVLNGGAVPEFQPLSLVLPLLITTFIAVIVSRKRSASRSLSQTNVFTSSKHSF
jgi:hypothetical protein